MDISEAVKSTIEEYLQGDRVVLFMKGTRQQPMCGFSARTVAALDSLLPDYATVNVLDDEDIREGIKAYGNWPTIPQLYIEGELVGGCDIVLNMVNTGELHEQLGLAAPDRSPPEITVTPAAAEKIREAMEGHESMALHFQVDANWDAQFNLAPSQGGEIASESNGIKVMMDLATAQRARGAVIDWVSNMQGEGLSLDLPQAPPPVKQMTVQELAENLKNGNVTLIDIRPESERARASIEGALMLDRPTMEKLEAMPKDSRMAFLCHHGNSSMGAADYFQIDSSVPTY
jgi:monothiol glutaredoxin